MLKVFYLENKNFNNNSLNLNFKVFFNDKFSGN